MEAIRQSDPSTELVFRLWGDSWAPVMGRLGRAPGRCWNATTGRSRCTACVESCPERCITLAPAPALDLSRCTGCGLCAAACHTGALSLPALDTTGFMAAVGNRLAAVAPAAGTVVLTCPGQSPTTAPAGASATTPAGAQATEAPRAPVTCLAALSDAHLLGMLRSGAAAVALDAGACDCCRVPDGEARLQHRAASARAWGEALQVGNAVHVARHPERDRRQAQPLLEEVRYTRRDLFRRVRTRVGVLAEASADPQPMADGAGQGPEVERVPARRRLLLGFRDAASPPLVAPADPRALPLRAVQPTAECMLCHSCSRLCPSGALQQDEEPRRSVLRFDALRCLGCAQCEQLCPHGVLRARPLESADFPLSPGRIVFARRKVPCSRCERPMFAEGGNDTCPACRKLAGVDDSMRAILGW